jgi:hypothetical protein
MALITITNPDGTSTTFHSGRSSVMILDKGEERIIASDGSEHPLSEADIAWLRRSRQAALQASRASRNGRHAPR